MILEFSLPSLKILPKSPSYSQDMTDMLSLYPGCIYCLCFTSLLRHDFEKWNSEKLKILKNYINGKQVSIIEFQMALIGKNNAWKEEKTMKQIIGQLID